LIAVKFQDGRDLHQQHRQASEIALRDPNDRGDPLLVDERILRQR
jgi:hypothetical protein